MTRLAPAALLIALAVAAFAQDDASKVPKALDGKYTLSNMTVAGKPVPKGEKEREAFVIRNGTLIAVSPDGKKEDPLAFKLTGGANVEFTEPGKPGGPHVLGVYKLDGKTLTFTLVESNKPEDRPKDIAAAGEKVITLVLEKAGDDKAKDPKTGKDK